MVTLSRTVRLVINPEGLRDDPVRNGFAGAPAMRGLGRFYELTVGCRGEPDPVTGYLVNIKDIDRAVRHEALPVIHQFCREDPTAEPAVVMRVFLPRVDRALEGIVDHCRWMLTPYYSIEMTTDDTNSVTIRQQFDFAAAHRLHAPTLNDAENRKVFGRCNNPRGHGHNYRVEAAVRTRLSDRGVPAFSLSDLERVVNERVIDRFDHKNLNEDTAEFGAPGGVNSSVENIAKVCFDLLAPAVSESSQQQATLREVTVWETDRTCCTYAGK